MPRPSIGTAAVAVAALAASLLAPLHSMAAADPYGDAMTVEFGVNEHSSIPVDLTLPAPGDGRRVATVTFRWTQNVPTYQDTSTGSFVVETPHCVADAACQVHAVVPTGRMRNSVMTWVGIGVADDDTTTIGSTSRTLKINNPKPTVSFTAPGNYDTFWNEQVTLAAAATPSTSGAPIKAVRFYVNPQSEENFPYREDTTAPYSVSVPSSEIAESTKGGTLYVVAEDVEGNLSQYGYEDYRPYLRYVRVGPPPIVSWRVPAVDGRAAGGMSTGSFVHWDTALPESAPPNETSPEWPFIDRIQIYRDGALLTDRRYDQTSRWGTDFGDGRKSRTAEGYEHWTASGGMTPGEHTVTLRVTTSYGAVGTATRKFVITDGVRLGRVMSRGRVVRDGHLVTAGTWVPLRFDVEGRVAGSAIEYYDVALGETSLLGSAAGCHRLAWWTCPGEVTVRADWSVPSRPGTYSLAFSGQEHFDDAPTTTRRTFTVQPAGTIRAGVSSHLVPAGKSVVVRGRVVRVDTGRGVRDVPVTLTWRKAGTTRWIAVASRTSGLRGRVRAVVVRRATGFYRWVSPGDPGRLGPARSKALKVRVTR